MLAEFCVVAKQKSSASPECDEASANAPFAEKSPAPGMRGHQCFQTLAHARSELRATQETSSERGQ